MSKIDTAVVWGPKVLGRGRLDQRRWAYLVEAPFDMHSDIPDLIGMKVCLDGSEFEIRGTLPRLPVVPITKGELMELLVRRVGL
jgi:hypothetical protein